MSVFLFRGFAFELEWNWEVLIQEFVILTTEVPDYCRTENVHIRAFIRKENGKGPSVVTYVLKKTKQ